MRPRHLPAVIAISLLGASFTGLGQAKKLTTAEAKNHVGEQATVCGKVASGLWYAKIPSVLSSDREFGTYLL